MSLFAKLFGRKRIYLDYAAATPVASSVVHAMAPYACLSYGNASAIHAEGRAARAAIDTARQVVANSMRVRSDEVYFVSGGTEANNLALQGLLVGLKESGRDLKECEIITTKLEHPSILEILKEFEKEGVVIHYVPVDADGLINFELFSKLLSENTVLVTLAYANSEIGVVQDVKRVTRLVRQHRKEKKQALPYVHLDASQAPLYLPCKIDSLGVDMMTLDAGKCYGPKGVGVLIKKHAVPLVPLVRGGDQEMGLRAGTENTGLIVGCAKALERAEEGRLVRTDRVFVLREYAFQLLEKKISGVVINGSRTERIANNVNISIPGIDGEYATVVLDTAGIAVSTKSACSGATGSGSKVVYALGGDDARALSTIRITLGEETAKKDIDRCVAVLALHVAHMRKAFDRMKNS